MRAKSALAPPPPTPSPPYFKYDNIIPQICIAPPPSRRTLLRFSPRPLPPLTHRMHLEPGLIGGKHPAKLELEYLVPSRSPKVLNARNLPHIPIGWRPSIQRVTVSYIQSKVTFLALTILTPLIIMMKALRARSRSTLDSRFIQRRFQENQQGHRKGLGERSTRSFPAKRTQILRKRVQRRKTITPLHTYQTKQRRGARGNRTPIRERKKHCKIKRANFLLPGKRTAWEGGMPYASNAKL